MLKKYEPVSYELLRPGQIKALREKSPIAYLPLGTLEWHGFQLPLGCDSLKAHAICCEAALISGGVVLPPLYQGWMGYDNWGPDGWKTYTLGFNEQAAIEQILVGTIRALVAAQWKLIVGVTDHDVPEQVQIFDRALKSGTANWKAVPTGVTGFALMEGTLHTPDADLPLQMDHAAAWETSCMMYLCPHLVDMEELRSRGFTESDPSDKFVQQAAIGGENPLKHASPELGRRIIERCGAKIANRAMEMLKQSS